MQMVEGDPRTVPIRWFWCQDDAITVPYTRFASGNWSSDRAAWPWLGIGEKPGPRPWYDGNNWLSLQGRHYEGTDQQWAEGLTAWPTPTDWVWGCCAWSSNVRVSLNPPSAVVPLGPAGSGAPSSPATVLQPYISSICFCMQPGQGFTTPCSSTAYPETLTVRFTNGTGSGTVFNGQTTAITWVATQSVWSGAIPLSYTIALVLKCAGLDPLALEVAGITNPLNTGIELTSATSWVGVPLELDFVGAVCFNHLGPTGTVDVTITVN
jgi:hypothetical protein